MAEVRRETAATNGPGATPARAQESPALFAGPGEMRERCRAYDWAATALGAVEGWPPSLRALAPLVLAAGVPSALFWGPELTLLYNDAYIPLMGALHPEVLGRPHFDVVPESRAMFGPLFARVQAGETVSLTDVPTTFRRDALDGPLTTSFYTFSFAPVREVDDPASAVVGIHGIVVETTAEVARRTTEARQTFLLALSDALRPLADPVAIQGEAARRLGEHLGADRVLYADTEDDTIIVHRDWVRGIASMAGRYPASVWGAYLEVYLRGDAYVVHDVALDPRIDETAVASYRGVDVAAFIGLGLVKRGAHVASLGVHSRTPRTWTADEIELVRETAERTWAAVEWARAELALRASEAKYRTIFESIDEGFGTHEVLYDDAGRPIDIRYLETNAAYERHTGVSDCAGRTAREILSQENDVWVETFARVARTGEPLRLEQYSEGTRRWYNVYLSRVGDDGSRVVAAVFTDITERKRAEATLTAAAARDAFLVRLADALRPLADAFAVQDVAARMLGEHLGANLVHYGEVTDDDVFVHQGYGNGMLPMVGHFRLADDGWGVAITETYRAGRTAVCRDVNQEPTISPDEASKLSAAGLSAYVGVPLLKEGTWVAVLAVHQMTPRDWQADEVALVEDVAARTWAAVEQARAEVALRESEVRLQQAVAATGLGVFDWDVATDRLSVNAHFRVMFGLPPEEQLPVGGMMLAQVHPDDRALVEAQLAAAFLPDASGSYEVEYRATTPQGLRWFRASGQVNFEGEARRPVRLVGVIQDITERRVADEALRASLESAEAANRAKSEFLAIMSHELRTPLNAIDGYAELMELGIRGPVTDEQRTDLARIRKSQQHLLGLINGVLNYARMEAGAVHYDVEDVVVEEVLATCEALTAPQVRTKGLSFHRASCPDGMVVRTDREKLQQIVLNLISNAIKFTNSGGRITLDCAYGAADESGAAGHAAQVLIRLTDTGIGIAPEQLTRVFEPFVQVDVRLTRTRDGTGLGLAISRDLARGMRGDLTAESTPGQGSTFTLSLPSAG